MARWFDIGTGGMSARIGGALVVVQVIQTWSEDDEDGVAHFTEWGWAALNPRTGQQIHGGRTSTLMGGCEAEEVFAVQTEIERWVANRLGVRNARTG